MLIAGGGNDGPAVNYTEGRFLAAVSVPRRAPVHHVGAFGGAPVRGIVHGRDAGRRGDLGVTLVRPGAVTHAFDEDQRFVRSVVQRRTWRLAVAGAGERELAPPGYYMLFLVNSNGVPSVARFVRFPSPGRGHAAARRTRRTSPPSGSTGTVTLSWTASTDDTGIARYNVHRSAPAAFTPSPANRVGQTVQRTFADAVAAGTHYYVVTAEDVAGNVSQPSNEVTANVFGDTTAPTISITAPAGGSTLSGTVIVSGSAADDVGVSGVQFLLDGAPLGQMDTMAPYTFSWNTTTTSNGAHVISAVASDAAGNQTTAIDVTVDILNTQQAPSGLVAAFGFNEGSGAMAADASGQGNGGTLVNAIWTAGKFGNALSFNGSNAWVTVADALSLRLTGGLTLEAWVRPSSGAGWRTVLLKEAGSSLAYALYSANGASRPAGYGRTPVETVVTGTAAVSTTAWTHLALTFDGTTMRLFVNGTQVRIATATGPIARAKW